MAMSRIKHCREPEARRNAPAPVARVFKLAQRFPSEERFSLTGLMRRTSRSVCANLAEAWRKRRHAAAFIAKLSGFEAEAAETQVSAEVAPKGGCLDVMTFLQLDDAHGRVPGQTAKMADHPGKWIIPPRNHRRRP